jgi:hypothetical protein
MTPTRASWLGIALLHQLLGDNEPLVGDLIEERANRDSLVLARGRGSEVLIVVRSGSAAVRTRPGRDGGALSTLSGGSP